MIVPNYIVAIIKNVPDKISGFCKDKQVLNQDNEQAEKRNKILLHFLHPYHTAEALPIKQKIESFVDVFKIHLMCHKFIQFQFLNTSIWEKETDTVSFLGDNAKNQTNPIIFA